MASIWFRISHKIFKSQCYRLTLDCKPQELTISQIEALSEKEAGEYRWRQWLQWRDDQNSPYTAEVLKKSSKIDLHSTEGQKYILAPLGHWTQTNAQEFCPGTFYNLSWKAEKCGHKRKSLKINEEKNGKIAVLAILLFKWAKKYLKATTVFWLFIGNL